MYLSFIFNVLHTYTFSLFFQKKDRTNVRDFADQILIAVDGPSKVSINNLFPIMVRITNLSNTTKRLSLGIQEKERKEGYVRTYIFRIDFFVTIF